MAPNDSEFWNALQASDLLTVTQRKWIKKERFSGKAQAGAAVEKASPAQSLPQLLVSKGWLTPFQSRLLETFANQPSRIRPFVYGPFLLQSDLQPPQFTAAHQYQSVLTAEHADKSFSEASFIVRFISCSDNRLWEKLRQTLQPKIQPHLLEPVACLQLPDYRAIVELDFQDQLKSLPAVLVENANQQKPFTATRVLRLIGGAATALASLHQNQQPSGVITPAMIFLDKDDAGYLRSVGDLILQNQSFARQIYGIKEQGDPGKENSNPFVVTPTDKKAKPEQDLDSWKSELLQPQLPGTTLSWSDADFLAPELFMGSQATPASDLYSLGCLLYFLTTGSLPFSGDTWVAKHLSRRRLPDIPSETAKPIRKLLELLLEPEASKRQLSAQKLAQSIWSLLKSEPNSKAPISSPQANAAMQWLELQDDRIFPDAKDGISVQVAPAGDNDFTIPKIVPVVSADARVEIQTPTTTPKKRWEENKQDSKGLLWMAGSATALILVLGTLWAGGFLTAVDKKQIAEKPPTETKSANQVDADNETDEVAVDPNSGWTQKVVKDDGKLLWESPTTGLPIRLSNLPANPYGIIIVSRQFWSQAPAKQLLAAVIGVKNQSIHDSFNNQLSELRLRDFDRTVLANYQSQNKPLYLVRSTSDNAVSLSFTGWKIVGTVPTSDSDANSEANTDSGSETESDSDPQAANQLAETTDATSVASEAILAIDDAKRITLALVRSKDNQPQVALITTNDFDPEFIQSLPQLPFERLQMEMFDPEFADEAWPDKMASVYQLTLCNPELATNAIQASGPTQLTLPMTAGLDCSDEDRQFQLIIDPVSVWNEAGRALLGEDRQWLSDLVKTRIPSQTRAIYFSAHFEDHCYLESKFIIDRTQDPAAYLRDITTKLSEAAPEVERRILSVPRMKFWDSGLVQFDDMLTQLNQSLRTGQHNKVPTLNSWMPLPAAANLVAETDLFFTATKYSSAVLTQETRVEQGPQNLAELLSAKRTVKIPEQDLVNALNDMQTEIKSSHPNLPFDFQFELDGNNLLLDGITQNQKITDFNLVDQTLADILAALVLKATPDKSATSAKDPKCKLTWLPHPNKPGTILVTTRANAEKNNWKLPPQVAAQ